MKKNIFFQQEGQGVLQYVLPNYATVIKSTRSARLFVADIISRRRVHPIKRHALFTVKYKTLDTQTDRKSHQIQHTIQGLYKPTDIQTMALDAKNYIKSYIHLQKDRQSCQRPHIIKSQINFLYNSLNTKPEKI